MNILEDRAAYTIDDVIHTNKHIPPLFSHYLLAIVILKDTGTLLARG